LDYLTRALPRPIYCVLYPTLAALALIAIALIAIAYTAAAG
jgi:hypothetical protein